MNNVKIMVVGNKYNNKPIVEDIINEINNNFELSESVVAAKNPSDVINLINKENTNLVILDVESIVEDGNNIEDYVVRILKCYKNIHIFALLNNMDNFDFFLDNDIEYSLTVKTSVSSILEKLEDFMNQQDFDDFLEKDTSLIMEGLTAKQKINLKTEITNNKTVVNNEFPDTFVPVNATPKASKAIPKLNKSERFADSFEESIPQKTMNKPVVEEFPDSFGSSFEQKTVDPYHKSYEQAPFEDVMGSGLDTSKNNTYEQLLSEKQAEENRINQETLDIKNKLQYNDDFKVDHDYESAQNSTYNLNQNPSFNQPFMKKTIISLTSSKGGVGKTTTAKELASVIAAQAKNMKNPNVVDYNSSIKVALVDMNTSLDTLSAQMQPLVDAQIKPTINAWCDVIRQKAQVVRNQMNLPDEIAYDFAKIANRIKFSPQEVEEFFAVDEKTGLYMMAAPQTISAWMDIEDYQLDIIFKYLRQVFDVVVIDTSNNLSNLTVSALEASDVRLLILTPDSASTASTTKFFDGLSETELKKSDFYLVFNRLQQKYYIEEKDISDALEMKTISVSLPYENRLVQYADDCKILATDTKNKSKYSDAIKKLASSIVPIFSDAELSSGKKKKKHGLFSRKKRG